MSLSPIYSKTFVILAGATGEVMGNTDQSIQKNALSRESAFFLSVLHARALLHAKLLFTDFHIVHVDLHLIIANGPALSVCQLEVDI
jgi:hypothetical protein